MDGSHNLAAKSQKSEFLGNFNVGPKYESKRNHNKLMVVIRKLRNMLLYFSTKRSSFCASVS